MQTRNACEDPQIANSCRLEPQEPATDGPAPAEPVEVIEFTDPGCIWSWSSEPTLRWLRHLYGDRVRWHRVLGVQIYLLEELFPDRDPVASAEEWRSEWLEVAQYTQAPLTRRLEWMHTSTRPASAAVKAAELQGAAVADAVLRRLREAVFVAGRPADSAARIAEAVRGVAGLDSDRLIDDLAADTTMDALAADFETARRPRSEVVGLTEPLPNPGSAKAEPRGLRYGFPTLIVRGPAGELVIPGWRSADHYRLAFEAVCPALRDVVPEVIDADAALRRHRSLTPRDLELLTGRGDPPVESVRLETATVPIWIDPQDFEVRELPGEVFQDRRAGFSTVAGEPGPTF